MITQKQIGRFTCALLFATSLSACSVFSPVKLTPPKKYLLQDTPHVKKHGHHSLTLLVAPIKTDPLYDTTSMAYVIHPYQVNYFAKNEWAERPALMLLPLITNTLINTHYYHGVLTSPTYARYDRILTVNIRTLRQLFTVEDSRYQVTLSAELTDARTSRLIASKEWRITEPASDKTPQGGVIAANRATKQLLKRLATWVIAS